MRKSPKFSPEVIERAVRMVFDAKDQYLCAPALSLDVTQELRETACRLLRHYPAAGDMRLVAQALPLCWSPPPARKN